MSAHLHAARQLPRVVPLEAGQADELDRLTHGGLPLAAGHVVQLGEELDVAGDRAPRQQRGVLEDVTQSIGGNAQ